MSDNAGEDTSDGERAGGNNRFSRVFDVLELLVGHPEGMTLTGISTRLDLPASSAHNLLQRMVASEVVVMTAERRYSLGARTVRLGIRIVDGVEVRAIARRHLQELARSTGEDIYLAVRLGPRVVYVDRVQGNQPVSVDIRLGQGLSLHATSVGKLFAAYHHELEDRMLAGELTALTEHTIVEKDVLRAELDTIRRQGFAISREEAIHGVVGYALPVLDAHGDLAAAIHASVLRSRLTTDRETELLAAGRDCVLTIESALGRVHRPGSGRADLRAAR